MASPLQKDAFLSVRVQPNAKSTIEVAASLEGISASAFVRDAATKAARSVLLRELSRTDQAASAGVV